MIINKISVPCTIAIQKTHMFKPIMVELPMNVEVSSHEFLDIADRNCVYNIMTDEKNVIFISNFKHITFSQNMEQPRSMLRRKLAGNHTEENDPPPDEKDFD